MNPIKRPLTELDETRNDLFEMSIGIGAQWEEIAGSGAYLEFRLNRQYRGVSTFRFMNETNELRKNKK